MGCLWEKSEIPKGCKGKQIQEDWKHKERLIQVN